MTDRTLTSAAALVAAGLIPPEARAEAEAVGARYAIAVSPEMAGLIAPDDPGDPIAAQFLPSPRERELRDDEDADPISDTRYSPVAGIVHRYPDRVLLKAATVCPVYCRFCFRRETVGPNAAKPLTGDQFDDAIAYIRDHAEIWEVVITGGDPLILAPRRIREIGLALSEIPHVRVVRWHSRVPVVTPERVGDELAAALAMPLDTGRAVYVAVHSNHARELTPAARAACRKLARTGIALISQTVLLRGVNDREDALEDLVRALVETGIKPYYLHLLDKAPGTSHFRVPLPRAQELVRSLRGRLSGLCEPTLVVDIPGGHGKARVALPDVMPVAEAGSLAGADPGNPATASTTASAAFALRDRLGRWHRYDDGSGSERE